MLQLNHCHRQHTAPAFAVRPDHQCCDLRPPPPGPPSQAMEATVAVAADLVDRLDVLGLSGGLTEEDFIGDAVREPLCTCLASLCASLDALHAAHPAAVGQLAGNSGEFGAALAALKAAAGSQRAASSGRLDAALNRLASALEPQPAASSGSSRTRAECAEIVVAHLQAAAIVAAKHPKQQQEQQQQNQQQQQQQQQQQPDGHRGAAASEQQREDGAAAASQQHDMEVDVTADAEASAQLRLIARLLGLGQLHASAQQLLCEVLPQLQQLMARLPPTFFQPLASVDGLQAGQQQLLREVDDALRAEYTVRRRMLIERIKVTLQSFLWSPRVAEKGTKAEVEALIARCHAQLQEAPAVDLAADLPATSLADLAGVMRRATCGEGGSIDASVKRVIIGKVPDRGGRPEGRARQAAMPDWAARRDTGGEGAAAGGGGGGGGGRCGGQGGGRGRAGGGSRGGGGRSGGRGGGRRGGWGRRGG